MKKFIQGIKNLFRESKQQVRLAAHKTKELPQKPNQVNTYSLDTKTGVIRCEEGVIYVQAAGMRRASRYFKKLAEKRLGKKFELTKNAR